MAEKPPPDEATRLRAELAHTAAALGAAVAERDMAREATRRVEAQMACERAAQRRRDDEWAGKGLAAGDRAADVARRWDRLWYGG